MPSLYNLLTSGTPKEKRNLVLFLESFTIGTLQELLKQFSCPRLEIQSLQHTSEAATSFPPIHAGAWLLLV